MLTPAFILLSIMLLLPVIRGQLEVIFFTSLALIAGAALYPLLQYSREKGWFIFSRMTPNDFKVRCIQVTPGHIRIQGPTVFRFTHAQRFIIMQTHLYTLYTPVLPEMVEGEEPE